METIQKSILELMEHFNSKMADFQLDLQKANGSPTVTSLATDFNTFKTFITGALNSLQRQVELIAHQQDHFEMRARRKILLLHGVPEESNEDVSECVATLVGEKLKVAGFSTADIGHCHCLGQVAGNKPRSILLKLHDLGTRNKLWYAKTALKGSGITMSEFLTKGRHDAFLLARQHFGLSRSWTRDGCVIVAGVGKERHRAYTVADVNELLKSVAASSASTATSSPLPKEAGKKILAPRPKRATKK